MTSPDREVDLTGWTPRQRPQREVIEGRYVRLEPLSAERHGDDLFAASSVPDAEERFRYLFEQAPVDREEFERWLQRCEASGDPLFFAVVDHATDRAVGRQALMRIDEANGVAELGNIYWGPELSRTRGATEAFFLTAERVFSLGYRRFEWKCNNDNAPSKRAAERFGFTFEGVFRQHLVVKGLNRDTAWFSILDHEWPTLRASYERWLDPSNFDEAGAQRRALSSLSEA